MQGLTIIVATGDPARFRSALEVAAANAALDRRTRLFLQAGAVALLHSREILPSNESVGFPSAREMLGEAMALGTTVTACQSGLALAGLSAGDLPDGVETGGIVELLSRRGDDQLLMA